MKNKDVYLVKYNFSSFGGRQCIDIAWMQNSAKSQTYVLSHHCVQERQLFPWNVCNLQIIRHTWFKQHFRHCFMHNPDIIHTEWRNFLPSQPCLTYCLDVVETSSQMISVHLTHCSHLVQIFSRYHLAFQLIFQSIHTLTGSCLNDTSQ